MDRRWKGTQAVLTIEWVYQVLTQRVTGEQSVGSEEKLTVSIVVFEDFQNLHAVSFCRDSLVIIHDDKYCVKPALKFQIAFNLLRDDLKSVVKMRPRFQLDEERPVEHLESPVESEPLFLVVLTYPQHILTCGT